MAVIALLLISAGVAAATYFFRSSAAEAREAKARLQSDIEARFAATSGLPHVAEPRRFGTDEEKNRAEAVPFFAPIEEPGVKAEESQPSLFE